MPWRLVWARTTTGSQYISVKEMCSDSLLMSSQPERTARPNCRYLPSIGLSFPDKVERSMSGSLWESFSDFRYPRTVSTQETLMLSVCWATTQSSLISKWDQQNSSWTTWEMVLDVIMCSHQPLLRLVVTVG